MQRLRCSPHIHYTLTRADNLLYYYYYYIVFIIIIVIIIIIIIIIIIDLYIKFIYYLKHKYLLTKRKYFPKI